MSDSAIQAAGDRATVDLVIEDDGWCDALGGELEMLVREAVRSALQAVDMEEHSVGAELAVLLTDDARIAVLNTEFRGKPTPTNVLSWPATEWAEPADAEALKQALARSGGHLGDVALALGVLRREAEEESKTLEDHLRHLIVHGVLHLLGYDHQTDEEAALMEARERAALATLGVADPYAAERSGTGGDG